MATYLSQAVIVELDQAQAELYEHLFADTGGRCAGCGELEPCGRRNALTSIRQRSSIPPDRIGLTVLSPVVECVCVACRRVGAGSPIPDGVLSRSLGWLPLVRPVVVGSSGVASTG